MDNPPALLDEADPRSILRMVTDRTRDAILKLAEEHPELINISEDELMAKLGSSVRIPTSVQIMRSAFWNEYNRATLAGDDKLTLDNVYPMHFKGVYYKALQTPKFLAYMLCPPHSYTQLLEAGLEASMRSLLNILNMPQTDAKGRPNKAVMEAQIKVYALLDARKNGAFTQKIQQVTVNTNMKELNTTLAQASEGELDSRLEQYLKARAKKEEGKLPVPDITVEATIVNGTDAPRED